MFMALLIVYHGAVFTFIGVNIQSLSCTKWNYIQMFMAQWLVCQDDDVASAPSSGLILYLL